MQTTTSRRSLWSVLRAYRRIGAHYARTRSTRVALLRIAAPLLTLLVSITWVVTDQPPFHPHTNSGRAMVFGLVCFGLICTELFDVVVGWRRLRGTRPLVTLFDTVLRDA